MVEIEIPKNFLNNMIKIVAKALTAFQTRVNDFREQNALPEVSYLLHILLCLNSAQII